MSVARPNSFFKRREEALMGLNSFQNLISPFEIKLSKLLDELELALKNRKASTVDTLRRQISAFDLHRMTSKPNLAPFAKRTLDVLAEAQRLYPVAKAAPEARNTPRLTS